MGFKGIFYKDIGKVVKAQKGVVTSTITPAKVQGINTAPPNSDIVNMKQFSNEDAFYDNIYQKRIGNLAGRAAKYQARIDDPNTHSSRLPRSQAALANVKKQGAKYNTGVARGADTYAIAKYMSEHPELTSEGFNKAMQRRTNSTDAVGGYATSRDLNTKDAAYADMYDMYKGTQSENMALGVTANDYKKANTGSDWFGGYSKYADHDFSAGPTFRNADDAYYQRQEQTTKDAGTYAAKVNTQIEKTRGKAIQNNYSNYYQQQLAKQNDTTQRVVNANNKGRIVDGKWQE